LKNAIAQVESALGATASFGKKPRLGDRIEKQAAWDDCMRTKLIGDLVWTRVEKWPYTRSLERSPYW